MTKNIERVKLSRDFVIIQHFRLSNLFNTNVFCYFLHRYATNCFKKCYIYTMSTALSIVRVKIPTWYTVRVLISNKCCLEIVKISRYFYQQEFLMGIALAFIDTKEVSALEAPNQPVTCSLEQPSKL